MNIYKLWRDIREAGYDEVREFVVVAENELEARRLAQTRCGDEGHDDTGASNNYWVDAGEAMCDLIGLRYKNTKPYIVCRDFKAG